MAAAQRSRTSEPAADWMTRDAGQGGRGARPADAPPLRPLPLASRVRTRATRWLSRFDRTQEVHQFGDSVMSFDWVAKRQVCLDLIMTATSHTVAHQIAVSDQAADNALCRAFCDAHDLSDVAQPQFGIARDGEQGRGRGSSGTSTARCAQKTVACRLPDQCSAILATLITFRSSGVRMQVDTRSGRVVTSPDAATGRAPEHWSSDACAAPAWRDLLPRACGTLTLTSGYASSDDTSASAGCAAPSATRYARCALRTRAGISARLATTMPAVSTR